MILLPFEWITEGKEILDDYNKKHNVKLLIHNISVRGMETKKNSMFKYQLSQVALLHSLYSSFSFCYWLCQSIHHSPTIHLPDGPPWVRGDVKPHVALRDAASLLITPADEGVNNKIWVLLLLRWSTFILRNLENKK